MAVEVEFKTTSSLISTYLDKRVRYRCLVIQSKEMPVLANLSEQVIRAAHVLGEDLKVLEATQQFDDVGALSCDTVLTDVATVAENHPVVLPGPLHFIDYWSEQVRARFWRYFAAFSSGPGIIITDTFRTDAILGPFHVVEGFARGDVRCLKSRLESTQDRLA